MTDLSSQTLHLVARELAVELGEARAALEHFGEQQDDAVPLRRCAEHLHRVHGALRVVEVYGAALLAEEMEQGTNYLIANFAEKRHLAEGLDALMRAMVQLPTYLERVLGGGRDMALVLLPLLNDLRAVRGNPLLSEGTLLLLNLTSDQQANPVAPTMGEEIRSVAHWARKLRARFQLGLLGWIKGERREQNLEILGRTAEKLEQVATTQPVFQLWWVVGAVLEALRDGGLEESASIKRLLGQADREMRRLYEQGEARYSDTPALDLLNNLLYYMARARSHGPRVTSVRASFRLNDLLPLDAEVEHARESLAAPSIKLMKTVAAAIKEDLQRVKDALDIFVRKGGTQVDELAGQLDLLKKLGDTLGVLGLGGLRDKVQGETAQLQRLVAEKGPANDGVLLRIAATLINVEDGLDEQLVSLVSPAGGEGSAKAGVPSDDDIEFRQVTEAVLRECIVNMARIKEAIALSIEKPREPHALDHVQQLLRGITAGLLMLGKPRAVQITEGIGKILAQYVRPDGSAVVTDQMDRLADAIVAVEYYMETLQAGRSDPWYMLDNADICLQVLAEQSSAESLKPVSLPGGPEYTHTLAIDPSRDSSTLPTSTDGERTEVLTRTQAEQAAAIRPITPSAPISPLATGILPAVLELPPDKSDPEFLELFIEEAKEEIARLQQLFPMWDENPQDTDSLVSVRRSFHTLKGSGRMVGAKLIGEFAWAIETLLNRIINKTLDRTPDIMTVLREAVAAVPELVEQLETARAPNLDVGTLISRACALAGIRDAPVLNPPASVQKSSPAAAPPQPKAPAPSAAAPAPAAESMDPMLHEIFSKEASGHLATIYEFIAACSRASAPYPVTEALHRSCHTLSGIARTAQIRQGSKLADPLNHHVRKLFDNGVALSAEGVDVLKDTVDALEQVVGHIAEDTIFFGNHDAIVTRIEELDQKLDAELSRVTHMADQTIAQLMPAFESPATLETLVGQPEPTPQSWRPLVAATEHRAEPTAEVSVNQWTEELASQTNVYSAAPIVETGSAFQAATPSGDEPTVTGREDPDAVDFEFAMSELAPPEIAAAERTYPLQADNDAANQSHLEQTVVGDATLHGAAQQAENLPLDPVNFPAVAEDAVAPEDIVLESPSDQEQAFGENDARELLEYANELQAKTLLDATAPTEESTTSSVESQRSLETQDTRELLDYANELQAKTAAAAMIPTLTEEVAALVDEPAQPLEIMDEGGIQVEETLLPGAQPALQVEEESGILVETASWAITPQVSESPLHEATAASADHGVDIAGAVSATLPAPIGRSQQPVPAVELEPDEFDADVAAIFTEEAAELLETADTALAQWMRDRSNSSLVFELKRALHTLKGGARMAGIRAMGDLSHELESFMEAIEAGRVAPAPAVFEVLQASLDELHRMRDTIAQGRRVAPAKELIMRIQVLSGVLRPEALAALSEPIAEHAALPELVVQSAPTYDAEPSLEPEIAADTDEATDEVVVRAEAPSELITAEFDADELADPPADTAAQPVATQSLGQAQPIALDIAAASPELPPDLAADPVPEPALPVLPPGREPQAHERQEFARVDADLLDTLLNNAGEVSIFRSRLEQQVSSIEFNLAELGRTVTRLKEQLRKLELETEAQILHGHQEDAAGREDFDPLELDRYSTIQQLSRALAESVSDVGSIEGLLENLTREGQNLLIQQARVVTELQNGLMRTRMVPFQRHVQRLSRLVRQVAADTGKRAELAVSGASGELDRQVLERMLPPFEHMLRNAVVHGIETPEQRVAAGKPEGGTISISLHREGAEMVIVVQDDGRGIDVQAVRERARARGLLQGGRVLTDEEALQLVLEPGFSTASEITQHAGRGVGMDVVVAEIKKLGGALFTQSTFGQGARFTIRLPFTLAISQALIVRAGDDLYALPLPTIEGVVRVPRKELLAHLADEDSNFSYGGQSYRFQHLGMFVGGAAAALPEAETSVPVVLVRAGEHSTGLILDELVGSREIVVKSLGPQISSIRGISGATILGDGRIVIILDIGALVRSGWRARDTSQTDSKEDRRTFAMVVDDSITVRRVTQRLLERNGMRVMTAKDGVDALSILQDHLPDIILLDIEMPRMDGYELASQVRNDPRLADIPIVMITSRSGEKHRARAIELGVNEYLGKPYQESELLDAIEPLVQAHRRRA